jgi:hypothetical protein
MGCETDSVRDTVSVVVDECAEEEIDGVNDSVALREDDSEIEAVGVSVPAVLDAV